MSLPTNFQFSQASLSDYADCARRFQLRYLLEQAWPAVESDPLLERERLAELGRRFHKLIQRRVEGLPVDVLTQSIGEPELARWWQDYLRCAGESIGGHPLPGQRQAEVALSIPIEQHRLTAHFDLLAVDDEQTVIVDWKTERRRPARDQLLNRMQTRVYRYVVTEALQRSPSSVTMIYWFAEFPDQPEILRYDASQHAANQQFLSGLIAEIENLAKDLEPAQSSAEEWPKTPNLRKCDYCTYRSLCNRGVSAGVIDPEAADLDIETEIDLEQIDEIAY